MINPNKIKKFWENRGEKYQKIPFESISNLEECPELLQEKIEIEKAQVLPRLHLHSDQTVLDLGAGVGQWTFRFAPLVKKVVAVEYASTQVKLAKKALLQNNIFNVKYIESSAEDFETNETFDLIFISGLFVYMIDDQVSKLLPKLRNWLKPSGNIFLRDGTSILPTRYIIEDKYSKILKSEYSAIYRTRREYLQLFNAAGYNLLEDDQMFPEDFI
jgi:cyclopropane fatty-acyl-phospholipid synthase-like methyltransferase